ncbi:MAG: bifunctional methylenetetrahydrofolate dehydrogenase/methenyltetrahydrofolate cyclohydrolase FolD [Burkholderiaceae bacterium]|jgi:methylenetetrahydrofolate dehydrogenase (NADP+)/methenyltetrahydrofolate cyclohydrolase
MTHASIITGQAIAAELRASIRQEVDRWPADLPRPCLVVIQVGDDPASSVYVKNKVKACEEAGIISEHRRLPADSTEQNLVDHIDRLNQDSQVHGILVQLPLPTHLSASKLIDRIDPNKDVDGFHPINSGALFSGQPRLVPCTPAGVMVLLEHTGFNLRGAEAVVVGASNIVGKPQAMLLLAAGATVTLCNSKTKDLHAHCQRADVLIAAVGRAGFIKGSMIKPGAVVIDVGINRLDSGRLCGDVDFESASKKASWITPVPGGVGPMTIAMLLSNTLKAARRTF